VRFTDEQQAAIDLAAKGESFSLVAPAGSGKSATAVGMGAQLKGRKVLYLVYNTQARKEAELKFKHMSDWVDVRTTSQVAWRAYSDKRTLGATVAEKYKERMNPRAQAVPASEVAKRLKLKKEDFGDGLILDGYVQAKLAYDAIERFCNSARKHITWRDVPLTVEGLEEAPIRAAQAHIAKLAQKIWQRAIEPDSNLRFTMNYAFKLVAESGRDYGYDVVLVDEAQGSNDCTMLFVKNQKDAQSVMVGDPAQALYGWRGASDQILRHKGPRLFLTQSFRFGEAVAEEAMKHLIHTGTGVTIKGLPTISDRVTEGEMPDPDVVLTRTNAGAMEWAMSYLSAGKRVALVRGKEQIESLAYAASDLMAGRKPNNLELSAFETWGDLVQYSDEPGGGHLRPLVRLVQAYGVGRLIDACKKIDRYDSRCPQHDVAISTCHSIKGLEWKKVQIADDFFEPKPEKDPKTGEMALGSIAKDEAMIHYVAVTRAQEHLDRSGLAWVDDYSAPEGAVELATVGNG